MHHIRYQYGLLAVTRKEGGQDNLAMFFLKLIVSQFCTTSYPSSGDVIVPSFFPLLIYFFFLMLENVMATMGKCIQRGVYSEQNLEGNYFCSRCGRLISMCFTLTVRFRCISFLARRVLNAWQ